MKNEIVITQNGLGYLVYNNTTKDSIDIFPATSQGKKDLVDFVKDRYGEDVTDFFRD